MAVALFFGDILKATIFKYSNNHSLNVFAWLPRAALLPWFRKR